MMIQPLTRISHGPGDRKIKRFRPSPVLQFGATVQAPLGSMTLSKQLTQWLDHFEARSKPYQQRLQANVQPFVIASLLGGVVMALVFPPFVALPALASLVYFSVYGQLEQPRQAMELRITQRVKALSEQDQVQDYMQYAMLQELLLRTHEQDDPTVKAYLQSIQSQLPFSDSEAFYKRLERQYPKMSALEVINATEKILSDALVERFLKTHWKSPQGSWSTYPARAILGSLLYLQKKSSATPQEKIFLKQQYGIDYALPNKLTPLDTVKNSLLQGVLRHHATIPEALYKRAVEELLPVAVSQVMHDELQAAPDKKEFKQEVVRLLEDPDTRKLPWFSALLELAQLDNRFQVQVVLDLVRVVYTQAIANA
jgi:hypothetical protein